MLKDLEKNGMDAVRKYSRKFDDWNPESFELSETEINEAIARLSTQVIDDTDFCQANVRTFARAQLETMLPLEVEIRPGVILGHKHIPVNSVGSYIPGGRYPMFGSAQMSIIPAKVAGVKTVVACTPPVKGKGYYPATINAMKKAGADRIFVLGGVPAFALMAFGMGGVAAGRHALRRGQQVRGRGQAPALRPMRHRPAGRPDRDPRHRRRRAPIRRWSPATCSARPSTIPTAASA